MRSKCMGLPIFTVIGMNRRGITWPMGWASRVPIIATGRMGTPQLNARRATPVWPL